jgi:MFS family permease
MGLSTVGIGLLPTYASIGLAAPLLLSLCRFGQGIGLGGEWGGAVLLAIENAPPRKRAWYGMFPQLGAPVGLFLSSSVFFVLSRFLTEKQFFSYGWRLPFLASSMLVFVGLYVRLAIHETPAFRKVLDKGAQVKLPLFTVIRGHFKELVAGTLLCLATFVLFYLITVFALSWGTTALSYNRNQFLLMQIFDVGFFALFIPISALLAERGRRSTMIWITGAIFLFGLVMARIFEAGPGGALGMMALGQLLMGLTYGPLGTIVSELFPTPVRYSGSSLAFNLAGIFGASLAPYIATWLAKNWGLQYVGYYLCGATVLTLIGLLMIRETKDEDLHA